MPRKKYIIFPLMLLAIACGNSSGDSAGNDTAMPPKKVTDYTVVKIYPHDPTAFTEGYYLKGDTVYESTGNPENKPGLTRLYCYDLATGKVFQEIKLSAKDFGEGISEIAGKIYQLTWQQHVVYVYDAKTLKKEKEFSWNKEGWGMTTDGTQLILSDGSSHIYYVNPTDFSVIKTLNIQGEYGPLSQINELEYVDGFIFANVWQTKSIVKIDPATSKVVHTYDLTDIRKNNGISEDDGGVLNGIAYNKATGNLVVTGKNWPKSFEIKLRSETDK
ncbi:glutaminyl-peptide cyclotransferase [Arachidicoccus terrestris]|uniref:glutaminyl-peptide cyclotransferase n=1 Tax=Arachidicoccus terrestris TaxID=2875539 RepID=UPI001CC7BFE0|nr:glutaminyl-peptide cyclotransferase [Arachidicoccus terrestris]UAY55188.1 glutaminyl-peptide cyclotransferase [Arachidicoccus terrestris]